MLLTVNTILYNQMMKLFNYKLQLTKASTNINDFKNSACRCVQQELDLSELTWMDTSSYSKSKERLRRSTEEVRKIIALSKSQMDLFE